LLLLLLLLLLRRLWRWRWLWLWLGFQTLPYEEQCRCDSTCGSGIGSLSQRRGTAADLRERTAAPPMIQSSPPSRHPDGKFGCVVMIELLSCDAAESRVYTVQHDFSWNGTSVRIFERGSNERQTE
jgi:hypothetical protein